MNKNTVYQRILGHLALALFVPALALAGSPLNPPAAPTDAASAVYKTDDIYKRLQTGAAGAKRTGGFSEPSAGPTDGARKSLDEIMAVAPAADNTNGAGPADVKAGKTFWGLRSDGAWGLQTGASTAPASSYPAPVPGSGQTACYNDAGTTIPCAGTGQDGALQQGVALPSPRFADNNNGTVTDKLTGLIWLKNANCFGGKTWSWALAAAQGLKSGSCGLSDGSALGDWRLPNRRELFSLINDEYFSPALSNTAGTGKWTEGSPFSGVQSGWYWSSTTYANDTTYAWVVYLGYGGVYNGTKTLTYYVWPVRGGQ